MIRVTVARQVLDGLVPIPERPSGPRRPPFGNYRKGLGGSRCGDERCGARSIDQLPQP